MWSMHVKESTYGAAQLSGRNRMKGHACEDYGQETPRLKWQSCKKKSCGTYRYRLTGWKW